VYGLDLADQRDPHQFWANGAAQTPGPEGMPNAANKLLYETPTYQVTLTAYFFSPPGVYPADWVSQFIINSDGANDYVGQFTVEVAVVPEPAAAAGAASLGLAALAFWRRWRRRV